MRGESIWEHVARDLAGSYHPGDFFQQEEIRIVVPPWEIRVHQEPASLIPTTRLAATCRRKKMFFLHIERSNQGTMVATSHSGFAESVLALPGYREALLSERFTLELGPEQLWCDTYGIVADRERLHRLIEILAETLQRLRDFRIIEG